MRRVERAAGAVCALVVLLQGCSAAAPSGPLPEATPAFQPIETARDPAVAALLPARYRASGVVTATSLVTDPPLDFRDQQGQRVGINADLATALGEKLGVTLSLTVAATGSPGAGSPRPTDVQLGPVRPRDEGKGALDYIDYLDTGTSILVRKGDPEGIHKQSDLCGKPIAVGESAALAGVPESLAAACRTNMPAVLHFSWPTAGLDALQAGRVAADLEDFPFAVYQTKAFGDGRSVEIVGKSMGAGHDAIGVKRLNPALRNALQAALKALIADGTYEQILAKWHVSQSSLTTASINGAS